VRHASLFLVLCSLLLCPPGFAQDESAARLFGSWRLISLTVKTVGSDASPSEIFGPHPFGRLILTPEHYMATYISASDRKPFGKETEATAFMRTMIAYTGKFRLEGDKVIFKIDGNWNENEFSKNEQVRYFTIDGDRLSFRTAQQPGVDGVPSEPAIVGFLLWEREK
jgi:Lipocalin-like domain